MDENNKDLFSLPNNPHDKFFRSAMKFRPVALEFLNRYLPEKIRNALNPDSLRLLNTNYIDSKLKESISDLVFSCELAGKLAYIATLVEHQSTPERLLPIRVQNYLLGLLENHRKMRPDKPLPAVYALVFYHGQTTPYPYSLSLWDCFDDPLGVMPQVLHQPLPLVDVNQLSDDELKRHKWVGPMALALKYSRAPDITPHLLDILETASRLAPKGQGMEFIRLLLYYMLTVGTIKDVDAFVEESSRRLSGPVKGETMTAAEMLKQKGREEGKTEVLIELGASKFGELPPWAEDKLRHATAAQIQQWSKTLLRADNLEAWLEE